MIALKKLLGRRARKRWRDPVNWGSLRRSQPVSSVFGFDRGTPVDRYYIEQFLTEQSPNIRGQVLEIGAPEYTQQFGGDAVQQAHVLHATADNPQATLVGDLASGEGIPRGRFDCFILTQTLLCIYDVPAAVRHAHAALAPGGVVLATVPGISRISRYDMDRWGDFWRFTSLSARRLFEVEFGTGQVEVATYGNVLAATAFLHGIAAEELTRAELDEHDPDFEVTIAIRATRR